MQLIEWDEDRAWRDWSRVEACVFFGVRRWIWFILAESAISKYVSPLSGAIAILLSCLAFVVFVAYRTRDDARRAEEAPDERSVGGL